MPHSRSEALATYKDISVVFFGSGPVAAKALELLARTFTVEAVITKPRPEHHRGAVPVLDLCASSNSPCGRLITVSNKAELSAAVSEAGFTSRIGIVIDFGIIITQDVIDSFPLGIVNSHFSLLPQWRGADPITFSILSGQTETGVSLMRITAGLDEGPIIGTGTYTLHGDETTPVLTEKLIDLSDTLLHELLPLFVREPIVVPQEELAAQQGRSTVPTFSRKLTKADGILDFQKPANQLAREIRAFIGWPGSRTTIAGRDVVITAAHADNIPLEPAVEPGQIWHAGKHFGVVTSDGLLQIDRLKPAGKGEMTTEAFLAGYKLI